MDRHTVVTLTHHIYSLLLLCVSAVSVIGSVESGKSTLIGVLTRGCLDDGNGLARMQVFRCVSSRAL